MDRQTIWDSFEPEGDAEALDLDGCARLWSCACGCVILIVVLFAIVGVVWLFIR